ncbi:uncharacterized protein LOC144711977 [Wolffia australiana]
MPFPLKIQPINVSIPIEVSKSAPEYKFRLKRFFERQLRHTSTAKEKEQPLEFERAHSAWLEWCITSWSRTSGLNLLPHGDVTASMAAPTISPTTSSISVTSPSPLPPTATLSTSSRRMIYHSVIRVRSRVLPITD